jgi:hypothetical protein
MRRGAWVPGTSLPSGLYRVFPSSITQRAETPDRAKELVLPLSGPAGSMSGITCAALSTPALNPRLDSARAKWERAKIHAEQLVAEMKDACDGGNPRVTRTSRRFDSDTNEIVWTAEAIVPEIAPAWPLMIGECVYNLRCALDHLWWELAIDHLGREPTGDEAPAIQFPIYPRTPPESFEHRRFLKHVGDEVVQKAKMVQAFDRPEGDESLLGVLADLSNHDKHRKIQPTYFRPIGVGTTIGNAACVDCHLPRSDMDGAEWVRDDRVPRLGRRRSGRLDPPPRGRPDRPQPRHRQRREDRPSRRLRSRGGGNGHPEGPWPPRPSRDRGICPAVEELARVTAGPDSDRNGAKETERKPR